jgi:hypothetical protein
MILTNKQIADKKYYQKNKEKLKKLSLDKYHNDAEKYKEKFKASYKQETKEQRDKRKQSTLNWINDNKELVKHNNLEYYHKNKEKHLIYYKKRSKEKYYTDPVFRLKTILSVTINKRLKNINEDKSKSSLSIIGLNSWNLLKEYIENQWVDGMNWDTYGNKRGYWSIDHIIPLSTAKDEKDVYKLNHYTNLRPMWHVDNIKKGNKKI